MSNDLDIKVNPYGSFLTETHAYVNCLLEDNWQWAVNDGPNEAKTPLHTFINDFQR